MTYVLVLVLFCKSDQVAFLSEPESDGATRCVAQISTPFGSRYFPTRFWARLCWLLSQWLR